MHDSEQLAEHFAITADTLAEDLPSDNEAVLVEQFLAGPDRRRNKIISGR